MQQCLGAPQPDPCLTVIQALWLAAQVASLELLQAPGLPYQLPRQLAGYPALAGSAGHLRMRSGPVEAACVTLCWRRCAAAAGCAGIDGAGLQGVCRVQSSAAPAGAARAAS